MPTENVNAHVDIVITIRNGDAVRELNQTTRSVDRLTRSFRRLRTTVPFLSTITGAIATLRKAIISMVGVLLVWNLTVVPIERALQLLKDAVIGAFKAVADFEERVLSLQGILASVYRFDEKDLAQNFVIAGQAATAVMNDLVMRNRETIASISETALVFQTMMASGADRFVKSTKEAVDTAILLSNAVAAITVGQQRSRQLAEETRSLFTGQLRATSLLTKLLFKNADEFKKWRQEAEKTGKFVEMIKEKLDGFVRVSRNLGLTMSGLRASFETIFTVVSRAGFFDIFDKVRRQVAKFVDDLFENMFKLEAASAAIGTGFDIIMRAIAETFGMASFNADAFMDAIIDNAPKVTEFLLKVWYGIADIGRMIASLKDTLKIISKLAIATFGVIVGSATAVAGAVLATSDAIERMARAFGTIRLGFAKLELFDPERMAKFDQDIAKLDDMVIALSLATADIAKITLFGDISDIEAQAKKAAAAFQLAFSEALATLAGRPRAGDMPFSGLAENLTFAFEELNEELKRLEKLATPTLRIMRQELRNLELVAQGALGGSVAEALDKVMGGEGDILALKNAYEELGTAIHTFGDKLAVRGVENYAEMVESLEASLAKVTARTAELAAQLDAANRAAVKLFDLSTFENLTDIFINKLKMLDVEAIKMILAGKFKEVSMTLESLLKGAFESIKEMGTGILLAFGHAVADAVETAFKTSENFGQALLKSVRNIIGQLLIEWGKYCIMMGTIFVAIGLITQNWVQVAHALGAIAVGVAAVAAGMALGGGGGGVSVPATGGGGGGADDIPTFAFNQADILVQQTAQTKAIQQTLVVQERMADTVGELNHSVEGLQNSVVLLSSHSPGVLVKRGLKDAGGVLTLGAREAQSKSSSRQNFSAAVVGSGLTGRF
jgi:hypothetical protein